MGAVDDTFGAWFVGMQVSTVAFGFSMLQAWLFYQRWHNEPWHLKILVMAVSWVYCIINEMFIVDGIGLLEQHAGIPVGISDFARDIPLPSDIRRESSCAK
jgi:hypothetical protein